MKKTIIAMWILLAGLNAKATVITNWVYVVSNIFHNVYTENVVTQKVKNTHANYYFTNTVSVVTNIYQTTFRTNINVNVIFDNFGPYVNAASNAAANAQSYANSSAASATAAGQSASSALTASSSAAASASAAQTYAQNGLNTINARINWFDQHSGETITMVNVTTNITIHKYLWNELYEVDYTGAFSTPAEAVYTNHVSGTVWPKIKTHMYGADGGASIGAYQSETYAGANMKVWPLQRSGGDPWYFVPAYIDSDDKGMRLQYLPTKIEDMKYRDGNTTYNYRKIVPEYLYWQDGYLYIKINWWENGEIGGWIKGKMVYNTYPRPINYSNTDNGTGAGITLLSRSNYGGTQSANYAGWFYHHTRNSNALSFPQTLDILRFAEILHWMRHGP